LLDRRKILYCPDYVVNSGGIINVMAEYAGDGVAAVEARLLQLPKRLVEILETAACAHIPTNVVADNMAMEMIGRSPLGASATVSASQVQP
jgi:leucine dehydrogenase